MNTTTTRMDVLEPRGEPEAPYAKVAARLEGEFAQDGMKGLNALTEASLDLCRPDLKTLYTGADNPLRTVVDIAPGELREAGHTAQRSLLQGKMTGWDIRNLRHLGASSETLALGYALVSDKVPLATGKDRVVSEAAVAALMVTSAEDRTALRSVMADDEPDPRDLEARRKAAREFYGALPEKELIAATRSAQIIAASEMKASSKNREDRVVFHTHVLHVAGAATSALPEFGRKLNQLADEGRGGSCALMQEGGPLRMLTEATSAVLEERLQERKAERKDVSAER